MPGKLNNRHQIDKESVDFGTMAQLPIATIFNWSSLYHHHPPHPPPPPPHLHHPPPHHHHHLHHPHLVMIAFLMVRRTPAPAEPAPQTTNLCNQNNLMIMMVMTAMLLCKSQKLKIIKS